MKRFDADRIIALSAMLVGLGSLATFAYQAKLMRDAEYASKLPYLYISIVANDQHGVALMLTNSGIGPAIVEDVRIRSKGRDFLGDPFDFFVSLSEENKRNQPGVDKVQRGRLIPAGASIEMLQFAPVPGAPEKMLPEVLKLFDIAEVPSAWYAQLAAGELLHAVIDITYTNVYGDRWRVRSDRIVPEHL